MKKIISLLLTLLLVIMSLPMMSFADGVFSIDVTNITKTTADIALSYPVVGSTYAIKFGGNVVGITTASLTGLTPNTEYTVVVIETTKYDIKMGYKVYPETVDNVEKFYFFDEERSGIKTYIERNETTGSPEADNMKTKKSVIVKSQTHTKSFTTKPEEVQVLPREASISASTDKELYQLGQDAIIKLKTTVTTGDNATTTLNDVVFYQNDILAKELEVLDNDATTDFTVKLPGTIGELISLGFTRIGTTNTFSKTFNYKLIDEFHGTENATVLGTTSATLTVQFNPTIYITVDNTYELFINGVQVFPAITQNRGFPYPGYPWQSIDWFEVPLQNGDVIAVKGVDEGVIAGFLGEFHVGNQIIRTGKDLDWYYTNDLIENWNQPSYTPTFDKWKPVGQYSSTSWTGLVGAPVGFDAKWIWTNTSNKFNKNEATTYFRHIIGGPVAPVVTREITFTTTINELVGEKFEENAAAGYVKYSFGDTTFDQDHEQTVKRTLADGTVVTLEAVAKEGFEFIGWKEQLGSNPIVNARMVEITETKTDITPTAVFVKKTVVIPTFEFTFSIVNDSAIVDATLVATVDATSITTGQSLVEDKVVTLIASPVSGYTIKEWTVNGEVVEFEGDDKYTINVTTLGSATNVTVEYQAVVPNQEQEEEQEEEEEEEEEQEQEQENTNTGGNNDNNSTLEDNTSTIEINELEIALSPLDPESIEKEKEKEKEKEDKKEVLEELVVELEEPITPLGDLTLPQTNEGSPAPFYFIGLLLSAMGIFLIKRRG